MTIDLDDLEAKLARATVGEWISIYTLVSNQNHWLIANTNVDGAFAGEQRDNADAIAALHNAAPALIAVVRAAKRARAFPDGDEAGIKVWDDFYALLDAIEPNP